MTYYTLAATAPAVGSAIGTYPDETYVAADPRTLPVVEMTDCWDGPFYQAATEIIKSADLTLVRVEPVGDVTEYDGWFTADGGWTVTGVEVSVDPVLGPQATRIREVVALAEEALTGWTDTDPVSAAYCAAVNERYDDVQPHVEAAEAALKEIGADGFYWTGCAYGWELLALAARDLMGTTTEWTQEAYDALTEPWRLVMGLPVHPEDTAPVLAI
ncbi:MAG: hypothetical protein ACRDS0_03835 [Pseudonocardiaceae bacterium]